MGSPRKGSLKYGLWQGRELETKHVDYKGISEKKYYKWRANTSEITMRKCNTKQNIRAAHRWFKMGQNQIEHSNVHIQRLATNLI